MANFSNSGSYIPQQGPSPSGMNFSTFGGGELPNISIHSGSDGTLPAHSMNSGIPLLNNLMFQTNPQALNVSITNDSYGALLLQAHMESMRAAQEAMKATVKMAVSNSDLAQKVEQLNATVQDLQRQLIMKNPHIPFLNDISRPASASSGSLSTPLGPGDSVSRSHSRENLSARPAAPAIKPDRYPDSVLWTLADAKKDQRACSAQNQSRPSMKYCIRHEDGTEINDSEWHNIRRSAKFVIGQYLNFDGIHSSALHLSKGNRKSYFRDHHPTEWLAACYALESAQHLVSLCAANWKAEHILSNMLTSKRSSERRAAKRKELNTSSSSDDELSSAAMTSEPASAGGSRASAKQQATSHGATGIQVLQEKRAHKHSRDSTRSRNKSSNKRSRLSASVVAQPLEAQIGANIGNSVFSSAGSLVSGMAANTHSPSTNVRPEKEQHIDVKFIWIDPTKSNIRSLFCRNNPPVPYAVDLLDAMVAAPDFGSSQPSEDVIAYLNCINNADPNSPEFCDSEDNSNQSWGHYQYNAGNMSINSTLRDWGCIGNTETACKLLAAALKTCKAARYICHACGVETSSYLSDVYLERMVERLWEAWKTAGGIIVKGKQPQSKRLPDQPISSTSMPLTNDTAPETAAASLEATTQTPAPSETPTQTTAAPISTMPKAASASATSTAAPTSMSSMEPPLMSSPPALMSSPPAPMSMVSMSNASSVMAPPASEISSITSSMPPSGFLSNDSAPTQEPRSAHSADSGPHLDAQNIEVRESLSKSIMTLQFPELKNWVSSHAPADASLSKLRSKNDLISFLFNNPALPKPTPDDIRTIIGARPSRKAASKGKKDTPGQTVGGPEH